MKAVKKTNSTDEATSISVSFEDFSSDYTRSGKKISLTETTDKSTSKLLSEIAEIESFIDFNVAFSTQQFKVKEHQTVMELAKKLCEEHPDIAIDPDMVGGMPHIKGLRLSVGTILAKLYIYGSIEKIKEVYAPDVSEHQIKEAIAYAQDFLEAAYAQS
jgi:uncharacterized protein (DUF433 family)